MICPSCGEYFEPEFLSELYCPDCEPLFCPAFITARGYTWSHNQVYTPREKALPIEKYCRKDCNSGAYMKWRREVFIRDAFVCQKCGYKKGDDEYTVLVAHHMESFEDYPEGRLDAENGVTLCNDCHHEFHRLYGVHHSRKWQTEEFLQD